MASILRVLGVLGVLVLDRRDRRARPTVREPSGMKLVWWGGQGDARKQALRLSAPDRKAQGNAQSERASGRAGAGAPLIFGRIARAEELRAPHRLGEASRRREEEEDHEPPCARN